MNTNEETLHLALDAFWAKIVELHPEREFGELPEPEVCALENHARNFVDAWLGMNKPVYYVQRTTVQVMRIGWATDPENAIAVASKISDQGWINSSVDTEMDYVVLDKSGKCY